MPRAPRKDLCVDGVRDRLQGHLCVSDSPTLVQNREGTMNKLTLTEG